MKKKKTENIERLVTRMTINDVQLILVPSYCPVCGWETEIKTEPKSGVMTLHCTNPDCGASNLQLFKHFVTRDAMNIDGLSEATLRKFREEGLIEEFADIYQLEQYEDFITSMEGFGWKSYNKLISAIDKSRDVKLANLIYALGIPNVGLQTAKLIAKAANYDVSTFVQMNEYDLMNIEGVGDVIATSVVGWLNNPDNASAFVNLLKEVRIEKQEASSDVSLAGKVFCCTGAVNIFKSRNELKNLIESKGGKLTGSVSAKTNYLITNDTTSGSAKNRAAAQLGIPVITEEEFISMFGH